jgi:integrase
MTTVFLSILWESFSPPPQFESGASVFPYIFCNSDGNLYNPTASFEKALKNAGVKDFWFHDLKRTVASAWLRGNTIGDILGRKSLVIALRYARLSQSHRINVEKTLDGQMDTLGVKRSQSRKPRKNRNL